MSTNTLLLALAIFSEPVASCPPDPARTPAHPHTPPREPTALRPSNRMRHPRPPALPNHYRPNPGIWRRPNGARVPSRSIPLPKGTGTTATRWGAHKILDHGAKFLMRAIPIVGWALRAHDVVSAMSDMSKELQERRERLIARSQANAEHMAMASGDELEKLRSAPWPNEPSHAMQLEQAERKERDRLQWECLKFGGELAECSGSPIEQAKRKERDRLQWERLKLVSPTEQEVEQIMAYYIHALPSLDNPEPRPPQNKPHPPTFPIRGATVISPQTDLNIRERLMVLDDAVLETLKNSENALEAHIATHLLEQRRMEREIAAQHEKNKQGPKTETVSTPNTGREPSTKPKPATAVASTDQPQDPPKSPGKPPASSKIPAPGAKGSPREAQEADQSETNERLAEYFGFAQRVGRYPGQQLDILRFFLKGAPLNATQLQEIGDFIYSNLIRSSTTAERHDLIRAAARLGFLPNGEYVGQRAARARVFGPGSTILGRALCETENLIELLSYLEKACGAKMAQTFGAWLFANGAPPATITPIQQAEIVFRINLARDEVMATSGLAGILFKDASELDLAQAVNELRWTLIRAKNSPSWGHHHQEEPGADMSGSIYDQPIQTMETIAILAHHYGLESPAWESPPETLLEDAPEPAPAPPHYDDLVDRWRREERQQFKAIPLSELPEAPTTLRALCYAFLKIRQVDQKLTGEDTQGLERGLEDLPRDAPVRDTPVRDAPETEEAGVGRTMKHAYDLYQNKDPERTGILPAIDAQWERDLMAALATVPFQGWFRGGSQMDGNPEDKGRIYLSIKPEHAAEVWKMLEVIWTYLNSRGIELQYKMATKLSHFQRGDSAVLYFQSAHQGSIYKGLLELARRHPEYFKANIPHFTAQLYDPDGNSLTGMSFGQNPDSDLKSFGSIRAAAIARANRHIRARLEDGEPLTIRDALRIMAHHLQEAGISLEHPAVAQGGEKRFGYLLANSDQRPRHSMVPDQIQALDLILDGLTVLKDSFPEHTPPPAEALRTQLKTFLSSNWGVDNFESISPKLRKIVYDHWIKFLLGNLDHQKF